MDGYTNQEDTWALGGYGSCPCNDQRLEVTHYDESGALQHGPTVNRVGVSRRTVGLAKPSLKNEVTSGPAGPGVHHRGYRAAAHPVAVPVAPRQIGVKGWPASSSASAR